VAARPEVTLVIRARDLTRGVFRRLNRSVGRLTRRLALIGGGAIAGAGAGLLAFGATASRAAQDIENAALGLGRSVEEIQALQIVGARGQANLNDLQDAFFQLGQKAEEAREGSKEAYDALLGLGVSGNLPTDGLELFLQIAEGAEKASKNALKFGTDLNEVLGEEAARQFAGLFVGSGRTLRAEIRQIADSNLVQSQKQIADAAEANRIAAQELAVAMNQLKGVMADQIPALVEQITRLVAVLDERNTPEGITPGGLEKTIEGTLDAIPDVLEGRARGSTVAATELLPPVIIARAIAAELPFEGIQQAVENVNRAQDEFIQNGIAPLSQVLEGIQSALGQLGINSIVDDPNAPAGRRPGLSIIRDDQPPEQLFPQPIEGLPNTRTTEGLAQLRRIADSSERVEGVLAESGRLL